jgi:hypothetical protein
MTQINFLKFQKMITTARAFFKEITTIHWAKSQ